MQALELSNRPHFTMLILQLSLGCLIALPAAVLALPPYNTFPTKPKPQDPSSLLFSPVGSDNSSSTDSILVNATNPAMLDFACFYQLRILLPYHTSKL